MALDLTGHEDALRRTLEIAECCDVALELLQDLIGFAKRNGISVGPGCGARSPVVAGCKRNTSHGCTKSLQMGRVCTSGFPKTPGEMAARPPCGAYRLQSGCPAISGAG